MLYRDDDICKWTDLSEFKKLHETFISNKKIHICAVLFEGLADNYGLFHYLVNAPLLDIQLHGWTHRDYSKLSEIKVRLDFQRAITYWNENVTRRYGKGILDNTLKQITTYYPPWNRRSPEVEEACKRLGLRVDNRIGGQVFNFHYWSVKLTDLPFNK